MMAGHRRGTDRQTRARARIAEHHRRVREAPTGRAQLAAAFDRYRSAVVRHPLADHELHTMATHLDTEAQRLEAAA
jgi:hypothetical protein